MAAPGAGPGGHGRSAVTPARWPRPRPQPRPPAPGRPTDPPVLLARRLQRRGHAGQGLGQGRGRLGRLAEGGGGTGGVDGRRRRHRRPRHRRRQRGRGRGRLGSAAAASSTAASSASWLWSRAKRSSATSRPPSSDSAAAFDAASLARSRSTVTWASRRSSRADVVGRRPPGLALVGQGRHRPGGLGLGRGRRVLRPPPGRLRPRQPLAGVALGPLLAGCRPRVLGVGQQGGQLVLPAVGPGQVDPPRAADVALGDRLQHPGPELVVGVEHPPGRHQRRSGQLGEVEEGPQRRRRGLDGRGLVARPGHGHRRLQGGAQQRVAYRTEGRRAHPLAFHGAAASCSTAVPVPHHRQETSSTDSVSTSSSSTDSSPPNE